MKDKKYYKKLAVDAARISDNKKAENTVIYDVETKTGLFYYAIITEGISSPQINAIEEEISKKFKTEKNEFLLHRDGVFSEEWKVLDYGGLVIHIFDKEKRDFYGIDKIYSDCEKVSWKLKTKKTEEPKKIKSRRKTIR
ncbi:MAG: ribosome silencing factor [Elusimicrobiales bacterium]|jgi:ribosome-associated protein|nr:ribosome silencing factor [Elusimicrobiales bacterium]NLH40103.1 ribosome silencing factor [Elusimicrobiota bacterium]